MPLHKAQQQQQQQEDTAGLKAAAKAKTDIIVQWDPERKLDLKPTGRPAKNAFTSPTPELRSLQMGIRGGAVLRFASKEFIASITDVSNLFRDVGAHLAAGDLESAAALLPSEKPYPMPMPAAAAAAAAAAATEVVEEGGAASTLSEPPAAPPAFETPPIFRDDACHCTHCS